VNATSDDGYTPLYYACQNNNYKIAKLLIDKGADTNVKTKNGAFLLSFILKNKNNEIAKLLIEKRAAEAQFTYDSLYISEIKTIEIVNKIIKNDCEKNKILFEPYLPDYNNKNLFHSIINVIKRRGLIAYSLDLDYDIGNKCVLREIYNIFNGITDFTNYNSENITFIVKQANFYNHNDKLIQTKTIGICPLLNGNKTFFVYYIDILNYFEKNKQELKLIKILFEQNYEAKISKKYIYNEIFDYYKNKRKENKLYNNIIYDTPKEHYIKQYKTYDKSQIAYVKTAYRRIKKDTLKNYALFEPEKPKHGYINLIDIIMHGISTQGLTAYAQGYENGDEFGYVMTDKDIEDKFDAADEVVMVEDVENPDGPLIEITIEGRYSTSKAISDLIEITSYLVKLAYLYDKNNNLIQTRTVGISPIGKFYREDDINKEKPLFRKMFWIHYPEVRKLLSSKYAIKKNITDKSKTFDDIFINQNYDSEYYNNPSGYFFDYRMFMVTLSDKFKSNTNNNKYEYPYIKTEAVKTCKLVNTKVYKAENPELFYPEQPSNSFKSLMDFLLWGISNQGLTPYSASPFDVDEESYGVMSVHDVELQMGGGGRVQVIIDGSKHWVEEGYSTSEVTSYIIDELYFYDENNKIIDKRVVGICPVREYYKQDDTERKNPLYKTVFWINYYEAFPLISNFYIYPEFNTQSRTFHEYFFRMEYTSETINETYFCFQNHEDRWRTDKNSVLSALEGKQAAKKFEYLNIDTNKFETCKYIYKKVNKTENPELFYPKYSFSGYKSLIDIILNGIYKYGLSAYNAKKEDIGKEFDAQMTEQEINNQMEAERDWKTTKVGNKILIDKPYRSYEITSYIIKELYLYNENKIIDKRVIGICPVREYYKEDDTEHKNRLYKKVFWIDYNRLIPYINQEYIYPEFNTQSEIWKEYFYKMEYKGEIINEIEISKIAIRDLK